MAQSLTTTPRAPSPPTQPSNLPPNPCSPSPPSTKKRKRALEKRKTAKEPHILHASTLRDTPWAYFHLALLSHPPSSSSAAQADLDPLTVRAALTAPLVQFLGTHGASVSVDILQIRGREMWMRVPREDGAAVAAAVASWVGTAGAWRVLGRGGVLGRLVGEGGGGEGLFR